MYLKVYGLHIWQWVKWILAWLLSLCLLWGLIFRTIPTVVFLLFLVIAGIVFMTTYSPTHNTWHTVGYFLIKKKTVSAIHFFAPKDLRRVKSTLSHKQAFKLLENFVKSKDAVGIDSIYVVTNLKSYRIKKIGFKILFPASPVDWLIIGIQHRIATGKWYLNWPWAYKL